MEDIIDNHNWIMDIHNCTVGNRKYACSIVEPVMAIHNMIIDT